MNGAGSGTQTKSERKVRLSGVKKYITVWIITFIMVNYPVLGLVNKKVLIFNLPLIWLWCYFWYLIAMIGFIYCGRIIISEMKGDM